jgi:hypothetical protein
MKIWYDRMVVYKEMDSTKSLRQVACEGLMVKMRPCGDSGNAETKKIKVYYRKLVQQQT